jgi:quercetin dioxygenase-like cupin family protein/DNA-binding XRE family transcriptional regulator
VTFPPIGERLRTARLRRGVSIRSLARDIGMSPSLISQIETDKSSPSVSTLYAITMALGISIEEVFGDPQPAMADTGGDATAGSAPGGPTRDGRGPDGGPADGVAALVGGDGPVSLPHKRRVGPIVRADDREALHLDSGVTWEMLGQLPDTHVDFLRITYAPGGSSSSTGLLMRHSGTEYGHVLAGRLTLTLGFDTYVLGPGDSVSFDSTTPHGYANPGTEPAVGVWFVLERPS